MAAQQQNNPSMFGRPIWSYVNVMRGPVIGPQPRLAQGTGRTGKPSATGTAAQLPGYVSDNEYKISPLEYQPQGRIPFWGMGPHTVHTEIPRFQPVLAQDRMGTASDASQLGSTYRPGSGDTFEKLIPRTIASGENGRELVGTYEPHDLMIGQRFNHQMRQATNWQLMAYPPTFRNTIQWQQVQKYRVKSATVSAQPLKANAYFLGYQVQPEIQSQIGQSSLGYMGSI